MTKDNPTLYESLPEIHGVLSREIVTGRMQESSLPVFTYGNAKVAPCLNPAMDSSGDVADFVRPGGAPLPEQLYPIFAGSKFKGLKTSASYPYSLDWGARSFVMFVSPAESPADSSIIPLVE